MIDLKKAKLAWKTLVLDEILKVKVEKCLIKVGERDDFCFNKCPNLDICKEVENAKYGQ